MANQIVAGNSTNGGTSVTTDTSGTLNIVTGSGSGSNAITIDASQNVTFANAISVAGNATITGTLTASGGVSGSITSGTAVSASGTSVTFTGIPSTVKRITVMFSGVSTNGTSTTQCQIGTSGGIQTTSYVANTSTIPNGSSPASTAITTGFGLNANMGASATMSGAFRLSLLDSATGLWVCDGVLSRGDTTANYVFSGAKTLSGVLDRIRITTVNGTDTFDAGSINILYE